MEENKVQETALAVQNERDFTSDLLGETNRTFTSLKGETKEEKAVLYKAMSNPDCRLGDMINQVIHVKDVLMETVECVNRETGELTKTPRVVLIDKDNKSYTSVSFGIYNALKRVFQVYGAPSWEEPIALKVIQVTRGEKKMLSLDIQF